MLATILEPVLKLLLPGAKPWVRKFLALLLPALIEVIGDFLDGDDEDVSFPEAVATAHDILDEALDVVPEWRDVDEARRDAILDGVVELALFLSDVARKDKGSKRAVLKVTRRIRRGALSGLLEN